MLPVVSGALQFSFCLAAFELLDVLDCNATEVDAELGADCGEIPLDVADLLDKRLHLFVGECVVAIADELLDLVLELADFTANCHDGVDESCCDRVEYLGADVGVDGCFVCAILVVSEC